jgi:hypothetical protein
VKPREIHTTVLDHEYARHVGYGLSASESHTQWRLFRLYAVLLIPAFAIVSVLALVA